ncbi:hypothetical protein [Arcticibacter eurypsychrophilus]|uniref:hypothetical protein n=1 Tax=Arcticibacter eurypsychrophilus TaxID=1434752 RepID=UPI00084D4239|nr:hypothetical protein [Arcticibacter eurypsychrophilus]
MKGPFKSHYGILFMSCLMFISIAGYSQSVTKVTDKNLINTLSSVETFNLEKGKDLCVGIFMITNGSGSANVPEADEVSNSYIISVSDFAEHPISKVFTVGPFYNPKITAKNDSGEKITFTLEHGGSTNRKRNSLIIDLDNIIYK